MPNGGRILSEPTRNSGSTLLSLLIQRKENEIIIVVEDSRLEFCGGAIGGWCTGAPPGGGNVSGLLGQSTILVNRRIEFVLIFSIFTHE